MKTKPTIGKKSEGKPTIKSPEKIIIKIKPNDDDLICGAEETKETKEIYDVFNRNTFFEIENVEAKTKIVTNGLIVATLLGKYTTKEKEKIQEGIEEVEIRDSYKKNILYIVRKVKNGDYN